jgi:molecular chaperone DnaJ
MAKNYYEILGVQKSASKDEIKKAFRTLAHKHHPDKSGGDAAKFKEASEAYAVLSDDKKRAEYDTYGRTFAGAGAGAAGANGAGGFAGGFDPRDFGFDFSGFGGGAGGQGGAQGFEDIDLGDIFSQFFGGRGRGGANQAGARRTRGADISVDLDLSFSESIFGVTRKILLNKTSVCDVCQGNGAEPGSKLETCTTCNGKGKIHETRSSFLGAFNTVRICETCHGTGKIPSQKCKQCRGLGVVKKQEEISVAVPPGINDGEIIRMTGGGEAVPGGPAAGTAGDLYIRIHVKPHTFLRRENHNLVTDLSIKLSTALAGGEYTLETLDGPLTIKIPAGIEFGEIMRVKGKGVPLSDATNAANRGDATSPSAHGKRGDLLVKIAIQLPRKLSRTATKLVEELKKEGI